MMQQCQLLSYCEQNGTLSDQSGRQFEIMADLTHPLFQHASQMVHPLPQWEEDCCLVSSSATANSEGTKFVAMR